MRYYLILAGVAISCISVVNDNTGGRQWPVKGPLFDVLAYWQYVTELLTDPFIPLVEFAGNVVNLDVPIWYQSVLPLSFLVYPLIFRASRMLRDGADDDTIAASDSWSLDHYVYRTSHFFVASLALLPLIAALGAIAYYLLSFFVVLNGARGGPVESAEDEAAMEPFRDYVASIITSILFAMAIGVVLYFGSFALG